MKALRSLAFVTLIQCAITPLHAQSNSETASRSAIVYADSLLNAFRDNNVNQYIDLSYPGIVSYYGGPKNFQDYLHRERSVTLTDNDASAEKTELLQLERQKKEWQCVVKKTTRTSIDGRKAFIISYLVGQSKDEGQSWKYFDVAVNSVENIAYIMPDIFSKLSVPQRQVIFEKEELAGK